MGVVKLTKMLRITKTRNVRMRGLVLAKLVQSTIHAFNGTSSDENCGAQERTRTSTLLTALVPKTSVYTISPPGPSNFLALFFRKVKNKHTISPFSNTEGSDHIRKPLNDYTVKCSRGQMKFYP